MVTDNAFRTASALLRIDSNNDVAKRYLEDRRNSKPEKATFASPRRGSGHPIRTSEDWSPTEKNLEEGYTSLMFEAKLLREEIKTVYALGGVSLDDEEGGFGSRRPSRPSGSRARPSPWPSQSRCGRELGRLWQCQAGVRN